MAKKIDKHGMNQGDIAGCLVAIAHALKDVATAMDSDGGITGTTYAATVALYYTVDETARTLLDLEKA